MSFLKKVFGKKDEAVKSYADFWAWFKKNEKVFFKTVKTGVHIEKNFFDDLSEKLAALREGYFFLAGMLDENTAELVLTADGNTGNIAFVEELANAAPEIEGWKFTALKPAMDIANVNISMGGYEFCADNINFYTSENAAYPDEIDITMVHDGFTEENKISVSNGTYIFLENYLGELDFLNNIDTISVTGRQDAQHKLIPVAKLKDYLNWRQKEFVEKYEDTRYDTANDEHSLLEATFESGSKLIAVINTTLLGWTSKASHPWIAVLTFKYDDSGNNGMPEDDDYELLNKIEEEILPDLRDFEGYLYIGRQTAKGEREMYFACKDFRKPSKIFYTVQQKYGDSFEIEYEIYKDKYWRSFERFQQH